MMTPAQRRKPYIQKWLRENRAKNLATQRLWRLKNLAKARADGRRWKLSNPERHRAHVRKAREKYQAKYPERILARSRKSATTRRMRMGRVVGDPIKVSAWVEYWRSQMRRGEMVHCSYCTVPIVDLRYFWMDHVIPVARGGPDLPENLVPACRKCNGNKHDRLLCEWLIRPHTPVRWTPPDSEFGEALRTGNVAHLLASLTYRPAFVPEQWEGFLA